MDDLTASKKSADPGEPAPPDAIAGKSTGQRTPDGKAVSSQNALKHGCRSTKTVLRDEDPAEFEATIAAWFNLFAPQDAVAVVLVQETARAHWFLKRNAKRLEEVEWELPGNAWHWTDEHQKLYNNFSRYKTAAERSFLRFYKELQMYYKRVNGDRKLHSNQDLREQAMSDLATVEQQAAQPPTPANSESGASNLALPASGSDLPPSCLAPPPFSPYVECKNET